MKINKKGFTLIELMVVMAIIAVLATLIIGAVQLARRTATETAHRTNAKTIQTALEGQFAKYRSYCGTATGQLSCGGGTYDFKTIADATHLNVKLGQASTTGNCDPATASNPNIGGGRVTITGSGYTITPVTYDCPAQDGDMTNDVLSMP